jgi:hypothetical protein
MAKRKALIIPPEWEYLRPWLEAIQRFQCDVSADLHDYYHLLDAETAARFRRLAETLKSNGHWSALEEFTSSISTDYHTRKFQWPVGQLLVLLDWIQSGEDRTFNAGE